MTVLSNSHQSKEQEEGRGEEDEGKIFEIVIQL